MAIKVKHDANILLEGMVAQQAGRGRFLQAQDKFNAEQDAKEAAFAESQRQFDLSHALRVLAQNRAAAQQPSSRSRVRGGAGSGRGDERAILLQEMKNREAALDDQRDFAAKEIEDRRDFAVKQVELQKQREFDVEKEEREVETLVEKEERNAATLAAKSSSEALHKEANDLLDELEEIDLLDRPRLERDKLRSRLELLSDEHGQDFRVGSYNSQLREILEDARKIDPTKIKKPVSMKDRVISGQAIELKNGYVSQMGADGNWEEPMQWEPITLEERKTRGLLKELDSGSYLYTKKDGELGILTDSGKKDPSEVWGTKYSEAIARMRARKDLGPNETPTPQVVMDEIDSYYKALEDLQQEDLRRRPRPTDTPMNFDSPSPGQDNFEDPSEIPSVLDAPMTYAPEEYAPGESPGPGVESPPVEGRPPVISVDKHAVKQMGKLIPQPIDAPGASQDTPQETTRELAKRVAKSLAEAGGWYAGPEDADEVSVPLDEIRRGGEVSVDLFGENQPGGGITSEDGVAWSPVGDATSEDYDSFVEYATSVTRDAGKRKPLSKAEIKKMANKKAMESSARSSSRDGKRRRAQSRGKWILNLDGIEGGPQGLKKSAAAIPPGEYIHFDGVHYLVIAPGVFERVE